MNGWAWVAGQVLPLAEARIALDDPGFLRGDGVFETLRARKGKLFRWDLHTARLAAGLAVVGISADTLAMAERAAREVTASAAAEYADDLYVRVQVVRDASGKGIVTALAQSLPDYPERLYHAGARLKFVAGRRDPTDPLVGVKSLSYLPQVFARRMAQAQGFDDALILNTRDRVCEAAYANVIARRGSLLYAPGPEEGALDGVTRRVLLDACNTEEFTVQHSLDRNELAAADEVLLVSTLAGVVPVAAIEGVTKAYAGPNGKLTRNFAERCEALLGECS